MKKTVFLISILLLTIQLNSFAQKKRERNIVKADTIAVDSIQYELIVYDPGFDTWLATRPSREFYSKEYYELKNRFYVSEWNYRYTTSQNTDLFGWYIDYDNNIDYGLDLNYKLYYYFRYFEESNRIKLIPSPR
jgi:hypothetical protein